MKKLLIATLIFMYVTIVFGNDFEGRNFGLNDSNPKVKKKDNITIKLENGHISGNAGCNRYFGSYKIKNKNKIKISPLASTKMYCEGRMNDEQIIIDNLEKSNQINFNNGFLDFYKDNEFLISFHEYL